MVKPIDGGSRQWQVDSEGGLYPMWGPDGKTLLYSSYPGGVFSVPVDGSGSTFKAGAPEPFANAAIPAGGGHHLSVHPDGDRILGVSGESAGMETGYLQLVTDWKRGLAN